MRAPNPNEGRLFPLLTYGGAIPYRVEWQQTNWKYIPCERIFSRFGRWCSLRVDRRGGRKLWHNRQLARAVGLRVAWSPFSAQFHFPITARSSPPRRQPDARGILT